MKEIKLLIIILLLTAIISCRIDLGKNNICKDSPSLETIDTCIIYVPNLFTPNGDGCNDVLFVKSNCSYAIENYKFVIKSSVGRILFESTYIIQGWDGTYKGKKIKLGNLKYKLTGNIGNNDINIKGKISLVDYNGSDEYSVTNCQDCTTDNMWDPSAGAFDPARGTGESIIMPCK